MTNLPHDLENKTGKESDQYSLPPSRRLHLREPSHYKPSPELASAIKVALLLGKPLLVTGEPGTGKTDLGRYLAWKMRIPCYKFDSKSTSKSQDLYYTYDYLGRYLSAQGAAAVEARDFVHFSALGRAILQSQTEWTPEVQRIIPDDFPFEGPRQSVVIIDEIDKAPRDFPNDLLAELDERFFRIPEFRNLRVDANPALEPILIITSNSEKDLPQPFLRRCAYFHIDFPELDVLREIVASQLKAEFGDGRSPLLDGALELFEDLRHDRTGLSRKPGTAELLDWLLALLAMGADRNVALVRQKKQVLETLPALIKLEKDRGTAAGVVEDWAGTKE